MSIIDDVWRLELDGKQGCAPRASMCIIVANGRHMEVAQEDRRESKANALAEHAISDEDLGIESHPLRC